VSEQRRFGPRQPFADCRYLIPERLRSYLESVTAQNSLLPRERDMVEVLVQRDLDRERERVPSSADSALGPRRSLNAAAAPADVLLLLDLDDAVADLDEVDELRFLELPRHGLEMASAARTCAVRGIQLENHLHMRQIRLLRRTKFLALPGRLLGDVLRRDRYCRRLLLGQRLDQRQGLLQLFGISLERLELVALRLQHAQQLLDLHLLRERDTTELLDVLLAPQVHAFSRSCCAIECKCFRLDDARRQVATPHQLAAFDEQR